jgi:DNA-binding FadR family transcriptional regulator
MNSPNTQPESLAGQLRTLIHQGSLGPGDRLLPERELAEQLGVGRDSLREAIKLLQGSGYVVVRRGAHGGTFVTELEEPYARWLTSMREDLGELNDILDFRIAIETRAAALAAERRDEDDLASQRIAIEQLVQAEGRSSFRHADSAFHTAVAHAARNRRLESSIQYARGELFSPTDHLWFTELIESCQRGHQAIYEAINRRDPRGAAQAMEAHIEDTREDLWALLGVERP